MRLAIATVVAVVVAVAVVSAGLLAGGGGAAGDSGVTPTPGAPVISQPTVETWKPATRQVETWTAVDPRS